MKKKDTGKHMDEIFVSNTYRVLEDMYGNTLGAGGKECCVLTQEEIAKELGLSRCMVNRSYKTLREKGYIEKLSRGRWKLSQKAVKFIQKTKNFGI